MSEVLEGTSFKKYALIDAVKSSAKYYLKTKDGGEGIRLDTPRRVPLYLQHTFSDKNGKQKTTRYKQGAPTIFQDVQIKEYQIPANDKFTNEERQAMQFVNGVLVTEDDIDQQFLHQDNNPQREDFTGKNRRGVSPLFKELDEDAIAQEENDYLKLTADALIKIFQMDKAEIDGLLALFFGASYQVPHKLKDGQNAAAKALEGNEERMKMVVNGEWGDDQKIIILLSKAIGKGIVSFDIHDHQVSVLRNNEWVDVKMIQADTYDQKEQMFRQWLASPAGELVKKDIEDLLGQEKPLEKKKGK